MKVAPNPKDGSACEIIHGSHYAFANQKKHHRSLLMLKDQFVTDLALTR